MRISGQIDATPRTTTVQLPRPAGDGPLLQLSPLPLGFARRLRLHQVAPPQPPTRVARDPQGRPLRQGHGPAVVMLDEQDADYLAERELYHQRVAVLSIREALQHDPLVEFETALPETVVDWRPLADRLFAELEAAQWSAGDLIWLCTQICRLSNLLDGHLAESGADFSSAAKTAGLSHTA